MRFAETVEAGMTAAELTQWESNGLSAAVPAAAIDGSTVFVNYLGFIFALDLKSGKLLWRSAAFHHLDTTAAQDFARMIDPARFAIVAAGEYVWALIRDMKEQNYFAPFHLECRRADTGEVVWQSKDLPDYAQYDLTGAPLVAGGKLFIAAKGNANPQQQQGQLQQLVLAIQPHDGKVIWKAEIGAFREGQQRNWYYRAREPSPQPRLVYRAGTLYVDTHAGVMARVDVESGSLDWGFGYKTDHFRSRELFIFFWPPPPQEPQAAASEPLSSGETFFIKGMQSDRLCAVEPNRMKVLWERPVTKSARLLGTIGRSVFLGGAEISALDLDSKQLKWATPVPSGSMEARVLVRPDGLWQLTPRGIYELDPKSGAVRHRFRGNDLGAVGGDLFLTDDRLLAVSNRTISAYPRRAARGEVAARDESATSKEKAPK
jgi:outer membrane protein assembly factor BamB